MKDSVFLKFCDQRKLLLLYKIQKNMLQAVGGLTKVAIQRVVSAGTNLTCTEEMFSLLKAKFCGKSNPMYIFKGISSEHLDEERKMENLKKYSSSKGSLKFQITVWATQENEILNKTLHLQRLPATLVLVKCLKSMT